MSRLRPIVTYRMIPVICVLSVASPLTVRHWQAGLEGTDSYSSFLTVQRARDSMHATGRAKGHAQREGVPSKPWLRGICAW